MFDSLDTPEDLGSARARLLAAADRLAGSAPIHHLGPDRASWVTDDAGVFVADSLLWRTEPAVVATLPAAVGQGRSLLFLEPTADIGWRRGVHRLGRPLLVRAVGHHFGTDVPALLRATGFDVVDLLRFGVGLAGSRSYAIGRAVVTASSPRRSPVSSG